MDGSAADTDASVGERVASFVRRRGATLVAPDPVNRAMIRHWCAALGDCNPAYLDEDYARDCLGGEGVVPPAMMQVWTMPGFDVPPPESDAVTELYEYLDALGFTSIVATNSEQDYLAPVRYGDVIRSTKTITSISSVKTTALGRGVFVTTNVEFVKQTAEVVGRQLHRVLKFEPKPKAENEAADAAGSEREVRPAGAASQRPRPNVTPDTAFFFEAAKKRTLVVQKCLICGAIQHPPTAACSACGSLELGAQELLGRGTLFSFTVVHSPVVPPFVAPYVVVLVELEEGVRIVSELVGTLPVDVRIGLPLQVEFLDVDPDLTLPVFRVCEPPGHEASR